MLVGDATIKSIYGKPKFNLVKPYGAGRDVNLSTDFLKLIPSRHPLNKKYVELKCQNCKKIFQQSYSAYKTRRKRGIISISCSRSCGAILGSKLKNQGNKFYYFINAIDMTTKRRRYEPSNLTVEYLENLWNQQNGRCAYTGIGMILPFKKRNSRSLSNLINGSLDRIDSKKGYIKGNVEFVCVGINFAKNNFPKNQMQEFIKLIKENV